MKELDENGCSNDDSDGVGPQDSGPNKESKDLLPAPVYSPISYLFGSFGDGSVVWERACGRRATC